MNDGGHLVRCLGRERRIWRQAPDEEGRTFAIEGGLAGLNGRYRPPGDAVHWNLSGERPAWLPIAWLCCEADPDAGPGFASAILGAKPGNDVPALVACDWLVAAAEQGSGGGHPVLRVISRTGDDPVDAPPPDCTPGTNN